MNATLRTAAISVSADDDLLGHAARVARGRRTDQFRVEARRLRACRGAIGTIAKLGAFTHAIAARINCGRRRSRTDVVYFPTHWLS
jgi:hypothetical protein